MWLVLPLASVLFPKLVHSAAKAEKTNLGTLVLLGTAVLAVTGAAGTSVLGRWVVAFVYDETYARAVTTLLPWYVFAMVPLSVANVLLNNLLARPASKWALAFSVLGVALAYLYAITRFHESMEMVVQTMGVANLVFLGVCAWFTWRGKAT